MSEPTEMTASSEPTHVFPLLADPEGYRANTVDMENDPAAREYWIAVFEHHLDGLVDRAIESEGGGADAERRAGELKRRFGAMLGRLREDPTVLGSLSILRICQWREQLLRESGFADPYRQVKAQENDLALQVLPGLLAELDAMDEPARWAALWRGVFAGNIFDLGAKSTTELYMDGRIDFRATRAKITPDRWLVDHSGTFADRLATGRWRKVVAFVDNAGADVVLGMLPLIRELVRREMTVVVTANTAPALNDIVIDELRPVLDRAAEVDDLLAGALADGRIRPVASGNGAPLIDLRRVSGELAAASAEADLVILEGMGRAIETNWEARFTCEALKLAMVKEQYLADLLGGRLYDVVCRFDAAASEG